MNTNDLPELPLTEEQIVNMGSSSIQRQLYVNFFQAEKLKEQAKAAIELKKRCEELERAGDEMAKAIEQLIKCYIQASKALCEPDAEDDDEVFDGEAALKNWHKVKEGE